MRDLVHDAVAEVDAERAGVRTRTASGSRTTTSSSRSAPARRPPIARGHHVRRGRRRGGAARARCATPRRATSTASPSSCRRDDLAAAALRARADDGARRPGAWAPIASGSLLVTPEERPLAMFGADGERRRRRAARAAGDRVHRLRLRRGRARPPDRRPRRPAHRRRPRRQPAPPRGHARSRASPPTPTGSSRSTRTAAWPDLAGVYAAGDGTAFPIKQGGLATQQADAVAETIAAAAGAPVEPRAVPARAARACS